MAKAGKVATMDESIEVKNICDWVNFQDNNLAFTAMGVPPVNLIPGNNDAARIYMLCRWQTINGCDGAPIDINHLAIWAAIDHDYGRPLCKISGADAYECFLKVIDVFHCLLKERMEENE